MWIWGVVLGLQVHGLMVSVGICLDFCGTCWCLRLDCYCDMDVGFG